MEKKLFIASMIVAVIAAIFCLIPQAVYAEDVAAPAMVPVTPQPTQAAPITVSENEPVVIISLSSQTLTIVSGNQVLLQTGVVTGTAGTKRATPTGVFEITGKVAGKYLRGRGYKTWVDYWMPFNKNIGIHDAPWRTDDQFGTDQYTKAGSHGCVNVSPSVAGQIYNLVQKGTKVIVAE